MRIYNSKEEFLSRPHVTITNKSFGITAIHFSVKYQGKRTPKDSITNESEIQYRYNQNNKVFIIAENEIEM